MRSLAIAAFSFSAAIFAANIMISVRWLLPCAAFFLCLGLFFLFRKRRWLKPLVIASLAVSFGFSWFYVHDMRTAAPARLLGGSTREIDARILDYPRVYSYYCRVTVHIENGNLPNLDAIVYDDSMSLADAVPGQHVSFRAKMSSADKKYGESYDYYNSRDIYFTLSTRSPAEVTKRGFDLRSLPVRINRWIMDRTDLIFPSDTAAFMKSLMLGDKTDLYRDQSLHLALSRAGNMHALAVSGLHIAFLIGLLQILFGKTPLSSLVGLLLVWVFVIVTGASPSAVRAAIMQSFLLLAPILRRENDPATSLSFALALLLLKNPFAAASVSLQLSFAAMAGILCFGERLNSLFTGWMPKGILWWLPAKAASVAACSLSVLPFTIPLTALHFGYIALLLPVTSILCFLPISVCFCGGYLACFLSLFHTPLGQGAAWLISWIVRYIVWISRSVASLPFAALYMNGIWSGLWIVVSYLLFIAARFLPLKRAEKLLYPTALSLLSMLLMLGLTRAHYRSDDAYVCTLDVGQGQCISVFSGDSTVVIDCGSMWTLDNAGEVAGRFLISHGRKQVDALILTHMDSDHINGVTMLMEMLPVRLLILPENDSEWNAYTAEILSRAEKKGTELLLLDEDREMRFGAIDAALYAPFDAEDDNNHGIISLFRIGEYDLLVTGDVSQETEERFLLRSLPRDVELLIVGHHGSKYSSGEKFLDYIGADTAVISSGYNTYGHPAEETLERLMKYGYNTYRTDRDGTVILHIEDGHGTKER